MRVSGLAMFGILGLFLGCLVLATNAQDNAEKELKNIEGVYVMVSGELKGDNLPEKTVKTATLSIEGDKHLVKVGDDTIIGTHMLAPTKKLKEIDSTDTEGPHIGLRMMGPKSPKRRPNGSAKSWTAMGKRGSFSGLMTPTLPLSGSISSLLEMTSSTATVATPPNSGNSFATIPSPRLIF
jgi:uncharacterized protein (TIGR03067 family)